MCGHPVFWSSSSQVIPSAGHHETEHPKHHLETQREHANDEARASLNYPTEAPALAALSEQPADSPPAFDRAPLAEKAVRLMPRCLPV